MSKAADKARGKGANLQKAANLAKIRADRFKPLTAVKVEPVPGPVPTPPAGVLNDDEMSHESSGDPAVENIR